MPCCYTYQQIRETRASFQQYMVQSLPVNFDLQHLAPAELVLGHNIEFFSHSQRSIIVNSQADIERIFTI